MFRLAGYLRPSFPDHATALVDECQGEMTRDRWTRVSLILRSMSVLPGNCLSSVEQVLRGTAISAALIAKELAKASYRVEMNHDAIAEIELAVWLVGDISGRMMPDDV